MNLQINLINKVEKCIVKNGCKMINYSKIGRDISQLKQKQFILLNMKAVLGMYPTDEDVYTMSCYYDKHITNC